MSAHVCSPPVLLMDLAPRRSPQSSSPSGRTPYFFPTSSTSAFPTSPTSIIQQTMMDRIPTRRVSVNLFGTPHNSAEYAREKLKEIHKRDSQRWNFDFNSDQPLDGRYKWERVGSGTDSGSRIPSVPSTSKVGAKEIPSGTASSSLGSSSVSKTKEKIPEEPLVIKKPVPVRSTNPPASVSHPPTMSLRKRPVESTASPRLLVVPRSSFSETIKSKVPTERQVANTPPSNVQVISRVIEPTEKEEVARKYLKTDSSRQRKISEMFPQMKNSVQKRVTRRQNTGLRSRTAH